MNENWSTEKAMDTSADNVEPVRQDSASDGQLLGQKTNQKPGKKKNKDKNKKQKKGSKVLGVICFLLAAGLIFVSVELFMTRQALATANAGQKKVSAEADETSDKLKKTEEDNKSLTKENRKLQDQVEDLNAQVSDLQDQNDSLSSENDELSDKNDELENGAAAQLVEIKNAHESGDWQGTIDKYNKLHKEFNGSAEDQEAKPLADDAQAQLDAEQQQKEAEEAQGYETGITYDQLARTPDDYEGKKVKFSGKVVQVIEGDDEVQLRIAVDNNYDTILFAMYSSDIVSSRVLEDDQITIYGTSVGTISYQSTMGGTITIPAVVVAKIDQ